MLSLGLESYYCLLLRNLPPELFAGAYAPSAWPLVATAAQELSSPRTPPTKPTMGQLTYIGLVNCPKSGHHPHIPTPHKITGMMTRLIVLHYWTLLLQ
jgi:hypothetical protein